MLAPIYWPHSDKWLGSWDTRVSILRTDATCGFNTPAPRGLRITSPVLQSINQQASLIPLQPKSVLWHQTWWTSELMKKCFTKCETQGVQRQIGRRSRIASTEAFTVTSDMAYHQMQWDMLHSFHQKWNNEWLKNKFIFAGENDTTCTYITAIHGQIIFPRKTEETLYTIQ